MPTLLPIFLREEQVREEPPYRPLENEHKNKRNEEQETLLGP